jgi:uncharacterized cupredoxin-like copper-binding protein
VALLVVGLLLLAVGLPLVGPWERSVAAERALGMPHVSAAPRPVPANFTIRTTDAAAFAPSSIPATSGENLTLTLVNNGTYNHTFTLSANGSAKLPLNWTPGELSAYFAAHAPLLNVSMPANSTTVVNLSVNASMAGGHFEFVSLVPYQFQAGMYGFLNVTPPVSGTLTFYVNASDTYRFLPDQLNASSVLHFPVAVHLFYGTLGVLSHTFTLSPIPNYNLSTANYTSFFTQHPPLIDLNAPLSAGSYTNGSFVISAPGYYEFICTIPGHFVNGMYGFLYVGVPVPAPAITTESTGLVQVEILIAGGALVAIGALLATVAMFTGRSPPAKPGGPAH